MDATAIVLAAGAGTRMKSKHAKVAHKILGKPMVCWVVDAALAAGCNRVVVVVGNRSDEVRALIAAAYDGTSCAGTVECVEQTERLGTAHAVRVALEATGIDAGPVVVLNGDLPLIGADTIRAFAGTVEGGANAGAVLTFTPPDPFGYGRVELAADGSVNRIIEQKDCTPEQAAELLECNAGCYAFDGALLAAHIGEVGNDNAQGEYYLPDMVEILKGHGESVVISHCEDYRDGLGVNSRAQLAELACVARERINARHLAAGVTMWDPAQVWIGPDVEIAPDVELLPQVILMGATRIGEDSVVGPNSRLTDTMVGTGCVVDETVAVEAQIDDGATCGPRAYLRPAAHLCEGAKAGTHVEIKKSTVGRGSKVPHLSYVGDATIGEGVNLGAGTITCNYDGAKKWPTTIGDGAFVGSSTMLVAPVNVGAGCVIGAGSVITEDVSAGALGLGRARQTEIPGWADAHKKTK
ncbi:MAG: bifunctional UDP-N-acetylglucosamine diphosphorylase/glucosamine-1-phosphate N-acetyltransferase GlmU [Eggerthellaceae bacterium]|nr:bifunctional UDP-N-acetylglucosamine diphosphorylase/glucosamine-1-phosphate N-acetyltransferase GlmU [Eggerthellaceae bacterium]